MKKILIVLLGLFLVLFSGCVAPMSNPMDEYGNLEVAIQDQFTEIVDLKLTRFLDNLTLLSNYSIDDYIVNISSTGTVPVVGDSVCFKENKSFFQADILAVTSLGGNSYQVTLDSPLDFPYTVNGGCSLRDNNWAKDGSSSDLIYSVSPFGLDNVTWDITRVLLTCQGDGQGASNDAPDISGFFTQTALAKGIVFRVVDGFTKNIFVVRDNFHMTSEAYDLTIYPKSRAGLYGVTVRRTFNGQDKNGVVIRLDSETHDMFQIIIRDDLSDMEECHAVAQGHVTSP